MPALTVGDGEGPVPKIPTTLPSLSLGARMEGPEAWQGQLREALAELHTQQTRDAAELLGEVGRKREKELRDMQAGHREELAATTARWLAYPEARGQFQEILEALQWWHWVVQDRLAEWAASDGDGAREAAREEWLKQKASRRSVQVEKAAARPRPGRARLPVPEEGRVP